MAVLLGALTLHGIQPGPRLMLDNPEIPLILIYALVLANIVVGIVGILAAAPLSRLSSLKTVYIAPVVMMLALIGAFAKDEMIGDVTIAIIFGVIGYAMQRYDYSRVALVIALVLGDLMQQSFHQTIQLDGYGGFFTSPISLVLFLITVYMLALPYIQKVRRRGAEI